MIWGIGILGLWFIQKTFKPNLYHQYNPNEFGELYNPDTDTWYVPKENEIDKGITFSQWDDYIIGLVALGIILFSKPWK